jgi:hypothetical protein
MRTLRLVDAKNKTKKSRDLKAIASLRIFSSLHASSLRDAIPLLHILSLPKSQ